MLYIHVTLVPVIGVVGEPKTKPTQHSVAELREIGIQPDIIVFRSEAPVSSTVRDKIALFCDIEPRRSSSAVDPDDIYKVPFSDARRGPGLAGPAEVVDAGRGTRPDEWADLVGGSTPARTR